MASWEDGPEYAPTERPDAFVAPDAVPLVPAAAPTPSAVAVADAPVPAYQPPATGVPLDAVEPPRPPQRDPLAAFDVAATPLTTARPSTPASATDFAPPVGLPVLPAVNAWDATYSAHTGPRPKPAWAPEQPFQPPQAPPMSLPAPQPTWGPAQVNPASFPPPQTPGWYPPPSPGLPGPGPLPPVTLGQMWSAATTGVMVSLLVGGLIEPVAFTLLIVAVLLASRIRYRRARVLRVMQVSTALGTGIAALTSTVAAQTVDLVVWWEHCNTWAQWLNWGLAIYVLLSQGDALRRNESPEPRP